MALGDALGHASEPGAPHAPQHDAPLPIEALEAELTTLAAHLTAASYRMLVLIEEFDRRQGWAGWGVRSCAHWLSWKCGVGVVAAREKVRVARALVALPAIAAAMRAGQLSYAKVRAMTRVATVDNERALLSIGLNGTASHVEGVVRAYRRTAPQSEQREQALQQQADRGLSHYWDHDGCLVVQGRLPPEQGALLVKALAAADQALCADASNASAEASQVVASDGARNAATASAEASGTQTADGANASAEASGTQTADGANASAEACPPYERCAVGAVGRVMRSVCSQRAR
jgi:hypothetical protein